MKKTLQILFFAFLGIAALHTTQAQTYDPYAVQVINNLIANNGLTATPNAPETWTFATWNDENPKQLIELDFFNNGIFLHGDASFAGLTTLQKLDISCSSISLLDLTNCKQLQKLDCGVCKFSELDLSSCTELQYLNCRNTETYIRKIDITKCTKLQYLDCCFNAYLTPPDLTNCTQLQYLDCFENNFNKLNVTNCKQLQYLECSWNRLTELDLTGLDKLTTFYGLWQQPNLTLYENEAGEYTCAISLNNPTFGNNSISYWEGFLKSNDQNVSYTFFSVQTNKPGNMLGGMIYFNYTNGINIPKKTDLHVYPNPVKEIFYIECENLGTIKLYDLLGKELLTQQVYGKTEVNIGHLSKGVYILNLFSEGKMMGNSKIVKQ